LIQGQSEIPKMDQEKIYNETVEDVNSAISVPDIDPAAEKRLLWKLDIHVVPILMFLFLLAFLDRYQVSVMREFKVLKRIWG
jgi:hypothetical protein